MQSSSPTPWRDKAIELAIVCSPAGGCLQSITSSSRTGSRGMLIVGLTGGIASGKTTVSQMLRQHLPVLDSDEIAHEQLQKVRIVGRCSFPCSVYVGSQFYADTDHVLYGSLR